jgi:hypothetical protein
VASDQVSLQIVLVTSTTPQPDLKGTEINGTVFRDTLAPVDALMSVREDLGNDAVARVCSEIYQTEQATGSPAKKGTATGSSTDREESNQGCVGRAGQRDAHLHIVEIQDQTYGLALGWKISQTSFSVVSWMLGDPTWCPAPSTGEAASPPAPTDNPSGNLIAQQDGNAKLTRVIVDRNSCVMKLIEGMVEGQITPPANASSPQGRQ